MLPAFLGPAGQVADGVTFPLLTSVSSESDRRTGEGLSSNYILHPTPSEVKVSVHNRLELRTSSNVLGIIQGAVEPGEPVCTEPRHS